MAFRWRGDHGPLLNTGLVLQRFWTYIAKNPIVLRFFQEGGGSGPPVPSLDPLMLLRGKRLNHCSTLIVLWLSMLCSLCLWHFIVILTYFLCYRYLVYMFSSCKTQKDLRRDAAQLCKCQEVPAVISDAKDVKLMCDIDPKNIFYRQLTAF